MREKGEAVVSVNDPVHQARCYLGKGLNILEGVKNFESLSGPEHVLTGKVFHQFLLVLLIFSLIAFTNHANEAFETNCANDRLVDKFNFQ